MKATSEITLKITIKDNGLKPEDILENIKSILKNDYGNACICRFLSMRDFRPMGNYKNLEDGDIECENCGNTVHTSFDYIKTEEKEGIPYEYYKCLLCGNVEVVWDIFYENNKNKNQTRKDSI